MPREKAAGFSVPASAGLISLNVPTCRDHALPCTMHAWAGSQAGHGKHKKRPRKVESGQPLSSRCTHLAGLVQVAHLRERRSAHTVCAHTRVGRQHSLELIRAANYKLSLYIFTIYSKYNTRRSLAQTSAASHTSHIGHSHLCEVHDHDNQGVACAAAIQPQDLKDVSPGQRGAVGPAAGGRGHGIREK